MAGMNSLERACIEQAAGTPMLGQVEAWAEVNSGSRNLQGLARVAGMLADAFAELTGDLA